LRGI